MRSSPSPSPTRRDFVHGGVAAGLAAYAVPTSVPAWAGSTVSLPLPGGPDERDITTDFPQKGAMILQRTRPPMLEFGGNSGVKQVEFSADGGKTWSLAQLGKDEGKYSFRQWQTNFTPAAKGDLTLMVRCTNTNGEAQPAEPNWNPGGFMRNIIESTAVTAA